MMAGNKKPILAITMGDPAGIGPEIVVKAWDHLRRNVRAVCIGNAQILEAQLHEMSISGSTARISEIGNAQFSPDVIDVVEPSGIDLTGIVPGVAQSIGGEAAYQYILHAIQLAMEGSIGAVVTGPINKEALVQAGHLYAGHTEIFAEKTNATAVAMMLAAEHFRVAHVSTHCSLREAINRCKKERILEVIELTNLSLLHFGIAEPYIAVAGLNPHSSEGGLFGDEEQSQIQPAIDMARKRGLNVCSSPVPPDTVFHRMQEFKEFDAVVAQYHDQGHIPAKLLDFFGGVNITLGLPIIRTSVDHGTAYGIVGKGKASEQSLLNAIAYAEQLALARNRNNSPKGV